MGWMKNFQSRFSDQDDLLPPVPVKNATGFIETEIIEKLIEDARKVYSPLSTYERALEDADEQLKAKWLGRKQNA
jgi:hypothetical protein